MPTDSKGNLYMYYRNNDGGSDIIAIKPDGTVMSTAHAGPYTLTASDGILYEYSTADQTGEMNVTPE